MLSLPLGDRSSAYFLFAAPTCGRQAHEGHSRPLYHPCGQLLFINVGYALRLPILSGLSNCNRGYGGLAPHLPRILPRIEHIGDPDLILMDAIDQFVIAHNGATMTKALVFQPWLNLPAKRILLK